MTTAGGLDDQVREIKARIDNAARQRARSEAERDSAQSMVDRVRHQLREEFGVDSPEEARAVLAQLEAELQAAVTEIKSSLEVIGA